MDRRQHVRHMGGPTYLRIGDCEAWLIDWSFGGIGASVATPEAFALDTETTVAIYDVDLERWVDVTGSVRRIDGPVIGIAFAADVPEVSAALLKLLRYSLRDMATVT